MRNFGLNFGIKVPQTSEETGRVPVSKCLRVLFEAMTNPSPKKSP